MANLYLNRVYQWEGDATQPYPNNLTYKTGRVLLPHRKTFYAARLIFEAGDRQTYYEAVEARKRAVARNVQRISSGVIWDPLIGYDLEINGDELETVDAVAAYSGDFNATVNIYGDGSLVFSKDVYGQDIPFKIKGGVRARSWEVEIITNCVVRSFDLADSIDEIMMDNTGGQ